MPQSEEERKRQAREAPDEPVSDDERVEQASEESFPASDPPSYTRTPRGAKEMERSEEVTEVEEEKEGDEEDERKRDERAPRGGQRGPRHSSTDPSEREETE